MANRPWVVFVAIGLALPLFAVGVGWAAMPAIFVAGFSFLVAVILASEGSL